MRHKDDARMDESGVIEVWNWKNKNSLVTEVHTGALKCGTGKKTVS